MYVVAGATGHVGSVVASELLNKGEKVKLIVREPKKGQHFVKRGAEVAVGTLDDADFLAKTLAGADGFFTLLPMDVAAPDIYASQRQRADAIARGVERSGVPNVVMLSSIGADLEKGTGPIRGLHYLEECLRTKGAKLTAIRASYFQENVLTMVPVAKSQGIYPVFVKSADFSIPMIATKTG
jgi:uncharacterized protein YbjT (DUF2867 family)